MKQERKWNGFSRGAAAGFEARRDKRTGHLGARTHEDPDRAVTDQFQTPAVRISPETMERLGRDRWKQWDNWGRTSRNLTDTQEQKWFRGKGAELKRQTAENEAAEVAALTARRALFEALLNNFMIDAAESRALQKERYAAHEELKAALEPMAPSDLDYGRKMLQITTSLSACKVADRDYENASTEVDGIRAQLARWADNEPSEDDRP